MPTDTSNANGSDPRCDVAEINRLLDAGEWAKVKELIGMTPDETERVLRESDWIDIDEVNGMLGITEAEPADIESVPTARTLSPCPDQVK